MYAVLKSEEFRHAYHDALDHAEHNPEAQCMAARKIIEAFFDLQEISPSTSFDVQALYFTEHPIEVAGHYKFLVPGTVHREFVPGSLFLLTPKASPCQSNIDSKEFTSAASAVEAVRLTLMPERVNGVISFILDAKNYHDHHDVVGSERAIGTALDHFNRAAADGLRHINSDAERGKRGNEIAGTRRALSDLRKKLQAECHP